MYALNADKSEYEAVLPDDVKQSRLAHPMPVSITFFSDQGQEPLLIKVGTAYESVTNHRFAPPDFGPLTQ